MLEKLAKQTAIYGLSTIVVRFLSYLLTPYYTRVFAPEAYGIVTDVYALIPFALTLLTMGMESSYFRFSAKAEAAGGDVRAAKRRLFATTWGITSLAAVVFFVAVALFPHRLLGMDGPRLYSPSRLRRVGRRHHSVRRVGVHPVLASARAGTCFDIRRVQGIERRVECRVGHCVRRHRAFATDFGVGWVFVANLAASVITWLVLLTTVDRTAPRIDPQLLRCIFIYSLPLLVSGLAGTASEFLDRQLLKYLVPAAGDPMAQLGIYGAVTKIAVVMMLFYQMYRLAAEPFFLSNFRKEDFVQMNAAALKYYIMVSMLIFLGIALFRDLFALIIGRSFRGGVFILPVVLGANVLTGVWLNLSFWYKREERTPLAILVTGAGLVAMLGLGWWLIPRAGYFGAAWARLGSEGAMVAVSWWLNRRYFPTPYAWGRIGEYVVTALAVFFLCEEVGRWLGTDHAWVGYAFNTAAFAAYTAYLVRREHIDVRALVRAIMKR